MDVTCNVDSLLRWVLLSNTVKRNRRLRFVDSVLSNGAPQHCTSFRRMMETLDHEDINIFEDEFEEFRARADSGGFLLHRWNQRRRRYVENSKKIPRSLPGLTGNSCDDDVGETTELSTELPTADASPIDILEKPVVCNGGARFHSLSYPGKESDLWEVQPEMRHRVATMPESAYYKMSRAKAPLLGHLHRCPDNESSRGGLRRIRSFKITPKGLVVNNECGSIGLSRQISNNRSSSEGSTPSVVNRSSYTILLTGAKGVGKSHILRQFLLPATHVDTGYSFGEYGVWKVSSSNHCHVRGFGSLSIEKHN